MTPNLDRNRGQHRFDVYLILPTKIMPISIYVFIYVYIVNVKQYAASMRLRIKVEMLFSHLRRTLGLRRRRLRSPNGENGGVLLDATTQNPIFRLRDIVHFRKIRTSFRLLYACE